MSRGWRRSSTPTSRRRRAGWTCSTNQRAREPSPQRRGTRASAGFASTMATSEPAICCAGGAAIWCAGLGIRATGRRSRRGLDAVFAVALAPGSGRQRSDDRELCSTRWGRRQPPVAVWEALALVRWAVIARRQDQRQRSRLAPTLTKVLCWMRPKRWWPRSKLCPARPGSPPDSAQRQRRNHRQHHHTDDDEQLERP